MILSHALRQEQKGGPALVLILRRAPKDFAHEAVLPVPETRRHRFASVPMSKDCKALQL